MSAWLLKNARCVSEGRFFDADVRVKNGRIEQVGSGLAARDSEQIFDAEGKYLLPGMIDDQVHFREPGLTHKADIEHESRAAVAGGVTTFFEMPNTQPPTLTLDLLEDKFSRAAGSSVANYSFYLGASNDNIQTLRALPRNAACGVKVFMGASTGNLLVDDEQALHRIFSDVKVPITTHCEHTPTILEDVARRRAERSNGELGIEDHPYVRSVEACYRSSSHAVELAREYGTRLHVLHLTTAKEMELFEPGPVAGKHITAEVCAHHLHFSEEDYARLGNQIKCNPAIKAATDRAALIEALCEDRIDVIATDHAPHTQQEKARPYEQAPAGLPLLQDVMPSLLDKVHRGIFDLPFLVRKTAHSVADIFDIKDRGYIRENYWADLVVIDMDQQTDVDTIKRESKCGWSPFSGERFQGKVLATFVSGELAFQAGELLDHDGARRVEFSRE